MIVHKGQIDRIFGRAMVGGNQWDVFEALYGILHRGFPHIEMKLKGWPRCGEVLGNHIWESFILFDRAHHPEVIAGGLWMNSGWSIDKALDDWEAIPAKVEC